MSNRTRDTSEACTAEKIVGVLGGMGPEATVDFMARVLRSTPAIDDQDHIRMVVDNNPKVPSRIKALIENDGSNPATALQQMARKLEHWGVDFLVMPCNTAHFYRSEVQKAVSIPVFDMVDLSVAEVIRNYPDIRTVGLLASTALLNLGIYESAFARHEVRVKAPNDSVQAGLMKVVRLIKSGQYDGTEVTAALRSAAEELVSCGSSVLLVACTELSIVAESIRTSVPVLDTAQILAEFVVKTAKPLMRETVRH